MRIISGVVPGGVERKPTKGGNVSLMYWTSTLTRHREDKGIIILFVS